MDLTPTISDLLVRSHSSKPIPTASARLTDTLDLFLRDAYQINTSLTSLLVYLRAIRQPYLSSAPGPRRTATAAHTKSTALKQDIPAHLTDAQREEIDRETSTVLRDVNNSITELSSAATLLHDTATQLLQRKYGRPTSLLFRWAAGSDPDAGKTAAQVHDEGSARTTHDFRESVLWYLRMKLAVAAQAQTRMVDSRVERAREKQLSRLSDVRNKGVRSASFASSKSPLTEDFPGSDRNSKYSNIADLRGHDAYNPSLDPTNTSSTTTANTTATLTPQQLQLFEEENLLLHTHFNAQLSKITQAEKSLLEISELQQTLQSHLTVQGEQIGNLAENAERTGENLTRGNRELKRAGERGSTAKAVFWGTVGLCGFLVAWDLVF